MGVLSYLTGLGGRDLAVDLGSANTVVYVRGRGVVLSEPTVVAADPVTGRVRAAGLEALELLAGDPGTLVGVRPLREGVDDNAELTAQMLGQFIARVHQAQFAHPRVVVCLPPGEAAADRVVEDACLAAGASEARVIERPIAAAIGAGLSVGERRGSMVADIGASGTEVAVITLGAVAVSCSIRSGGDELDRAIADHCGRAHGLTIDPLTAEELKITSGAGVDPAGGLVLEVSGTDAASGSSRTATLSATEVRSALEEPIRRIATAITETAEAAPPSLRGDIMDFPVTLVGGGSLLQGLAQRLRDECRMPVQVAKSPLTCVAVGAGASFVEFEASDRAGAGTGPSSRDAA